MRKLTEEQARKVKEIARMLWISLTDACHRSGPSYSTMVFDTASDAIDELTAKAGDKEHCGECKWWQIRWRMAAARQFEELPEFLEAEDIEQVWKCVHLDFKPGHCPEGEVGR